MTTKVQYNRLTRLPADARSLKILNKQLEIPEFEILPYHIDIWKVPAKMALTFRGRKKLSLSKDIKGSPVLGSCTSVQRLSCTMGLKKFKFTM